MNGPFTWKARHTVLSILFVTWVVSYLDRMVMATAIPYIAKEFSLSPVAMGVVMSAFFAGYALCQIPGGMLADKFGARKVMAVALVWWSAFTAFTGMVGSLANMIWVRVAFGIGEGIFPGPSFKSIGVWFPLKERPTAFALMVCSNCLGPALAPLFVAAIMAAWGWRTVFYSLFIPGLIMAVLIWIFVTDNPAESKRVSAAELAEIQTAEPTMAAVEGPKPKLIDVLKVPVVWQFFLIWFAFDITLWGFISWLPSYLVKARGFALMQMGVAASLPFFAGTATLVLGGWMSNKFFKDNRRIPVFGTQLLGALFLYLTYTVESANMAILYQTLAGAFLFMAMGSFWALPMSVIPKSVMGTATSFINTAGQVAGFLSPMVVGYLVQTAGGSFNTAFMFLIAGTIVSCLVLLTVREPRTGGTVAA